ncbi:hypothetical protein [Brucella vulpis]|uniref:hypothetical protein n=1 Tax=Brucella vulpis TaxID=981386 RepID=UPI0009E1D209
MKNPSIFGSSQKRGVLIPICSRFESVTFRESETILTLPEVCQQSGESFPIFTGCFHERVRRADCREAEAGRAQKGATAAPILKESSLQPNSLFWRIIRRIEAGSEISSVD